MALRLSLTTKGLILVSMPLLFEVGFICSLVNLQRSTEVEAEQALKRRAISNRINRSTREMYQLWDSFDHLRPRGRATPVSSYLNFYKTTYLPHFRSIRSDYAALNELTKDQPAKNAEVSSTLKLLDKAEAAIEQVNAYVNADDLEHMIASYRQTSDQLNQLSPQIVSQNFAFLAKHELDNLESAAQQHAAVSRYLISWIWAACAFNACFCIYMALFVVRGITNRLAVVSDNARHVAASEPLNSPIKGDDEIAELDRLFHRMAEAVDETARLRQEYVCMLTHDLRSPLSAVVGTLEVLKLELENRSEASARQSSLVEVAERNSSRMVELINDLLDIQKLKAGMMKITTEEVCVTEIFDGVSLCLSAWTEDHFIKLKYADTEAFVIADRQKLERVIFNLVANAIRYSPKHSTITLAAKEKGNMVQISVSDQGRGIPREEQKLIFDRFQQVQPTDELVGSGLGLTICQYFVEIHGGKIWVESEVGRGSTFTFTMPSA